ncbi:MAG: glyoxalase superfamily protein [Methyloligella sp. ZOD6]
MQTSPSLPPLSELKDQARQLRRDLAAFGTAISHGQSLERIANRHGYRNWNTLHAALGNRPRRRALALGMRLRGRYLGQPFRGELIAVQQMGPAGHVRITVQFEEPVDVVTFESFSAYRQRVSCIVDETGCTVEKTSDGRPHMELDPID